jgi:ribosomal protein L44E
MSNAKPQLIIDDHWSRNITQILMQNKFTEFNSKQRNRLSSGRATTMEQLRARERGSWNHGTSQLYKPHTSIGESTATTSRCPDMEIQRRRQSKGLSSGYDNPRRPASHPTHKLHQARMLNQECMRCPGEKPKSDV